jgi:hypothetical protein
VGADTKIVQLQHKFALKFKDLMFLNELAMFGETNTGETYSGDLLSSIVLEPFTFDNVIQITKT